MTFTPPKLDRKTCGDVFSSPGSKATTVFLIVMAQYGPSVLMDDPDDAEPPPEPGELYARINEDFHCEIAVENQNRLQAIAVCLETGAFFKNPTLFKSAVEALNDGDILDMISGLTEDLSLAEIMWAAYEVQLLTDTLGEPWNTSPSVQQLLDDELDFSGDEIADEEEVGLMLYLQQEWLQLKDELVKCGFPEAAIAQSVPDPKMMIEKMTSEA